MTSPKISSTSTSALLGGRKRAVLGAACVAAGLAAVPGSPSCAQIAPASQRPESAHYVVVTKGLLGSRVFPFQFRVAPVRIEIRNLIMGPGTTDTVSLASRAIMELRGGAVVTTIDGQQQERRQGDFWIVGKGSRLRFENRADVAVIRVIIVY